MSMTAADLVCAAVVNCPDGHLEGVLSDGLDMEAKVRGNDRNTFVTIEFRHSPAHV